MADPEATAAFLGRNAVDVLPQGALREQLESGRQLRVKFGIDPTAPDIHLGHVVVLTKLREFQDLGHIVVLIIGDFTARIGDPSGRTTQRPVLTGDEIQANADTFQDQAFTVLTRDSTEVRFNSEWLRMEPEKLLGLLASTTVARLLERDDFRKRMSAGAPISALELLYPVLQGYDSVEVNSDIEVGGTDQKFNLLFARDIQSSFGQTPQSIVTTPILPGSDGVRRMSKSEGNYIGVSDPPEEMFGKLMRVPDETMPVYYELLLGENLPGGIDANEAKRAMARRLVERFRDANAAAAAEEHFDRLFVRHEPPADIEELRLTADGPIHLPAMLSDGFGLSRSEARRLIGQGGVKINGRAVASDELDIAAEELDGAVVQVGRRRHRRVRISS